jgi:hypothetical protein
MCWLGGSVLASLGSFRSMWVTRNVIIMFIIGIHGKGRKRNLYQNYLNNYFLFDQL